MKSWPLPFVLWIVMVSVTVIPCGATAEEAAVHPDLLAAVTQLREARGPSAYTALRSIWDTWDRADPAQVEEQLRSATRDQKLSPPVRAYAGMLAAYARMRRGDLAAARAQIHALGFVDRWLVVGPFDNEGKAGLDTDFGPELDFDKAIVPGRAYTGKERPVRWRAAPDSFHLGWLDTGALLRPTEKSCAYATTFVSAAQGTRAPRPITVWAGTSGAFKLYFNGRQVLQDEAYRGHDADRFAAAVEILPGINNLTVKACGDADAPVISVRLGDQAGAPDRDLVVSNELASSTQAAENVVAAKPYQPGARGPKGPLQLFQAATEDARAPNAATLFDYAEYLVETDSDDSTEHLARDLARRAAEAGPTIARLLLAGKLAEDRNQAAAWFLRAEALQERQGKPSVPVLLALALHARGGPSWREAFPYIDEVLAIDPDNAVGIRGRVELYNDAGLQRTALATLERALERNPSSVNLLNMVATQLRALGRSTEAAEAESRYSALRFDDHGYLAGKIELAVARRDRPGAERWIERLLELSPDSQWALSLAARTYRALGQPERAVATYQRALELAPEDVGTLHRLADLQGELGMKEEQLSLLQQILKIRPQEREVREYLEHLSPAKARADEAYAWKAQRFLPLGKLEARGENRRILRDLTVTTVYPNGKSSQFRQVVFQPLTDAAAAKDRYYAFQYQADREVVQLRGAKVYRQDGRVDEAIEYGEGAADVPEISMYTSARTFYVQFPRLEPRDVVELKFRIDDITPRNDFADYFGEVVALQADVPTYNAEYVLITPKSRKLFVDVKLPGLRHSLKSTPEQRIHHFFAAQVAPIKVEPSMPPWSEVGGFVHVSTYKSWKDVGRWYWGISKDQLELDDETRLLAHDIAKGKTTELERVKAVYNWVVKNTRYVALEFGIYGYKPRRCVQTVARGWGDCKDKATVIVALLRELGIPATMVIVRTQLRGDFPSEIPSLAPFDHAIAYVPSLDLYLDGTAEWAGATELPALDQGALALQVNQGDSQLVRLPGHDPQKNVQERRVTAYLEPGGNARLTLEYEGRGAVAPEWRQSFHAKSTLADRVQTLLVGREFPGFTLAGGPQGVETNDLEDLEEPVRMTVRGTATVARREGDRLSLAVTPSTRLTPLYASLPERTHDVVILAFPTQNDTFVVKLPPGMTLQSGPRNVQEDSPFGSYSLSLEKRPGEIVVRSHLSLKVSRVEPRHYAAFRHFCAAVDTAFSPRLVIGK